MKLADIINAYCKIRTIDQTIPDDVLDFMKEAAIEKIGALLIQQSSFPQTEPYFDSHGKILQHKDSEIAELKKELETARAQAADLAKELHAAKVELVMRGGQVEADINNNGVMMVSVVAKSGEPNANGDIFLDRAMNEAVQNFNYPENQNGRSVVIPLEGEKK